MNFQFRSVALARDECARCGKPWLHPEWELWHSYPVAVIELDNGRDLPDVWCHSCVAEVDPAAFNELLADRPRFFAN